MDLGGPKLRTGRLEGGAKVARWRPQRNVRGLPVSPARICLARAGTPVALPQNAEATLWLEGDLITQARRNDLVELRDARGKRRTLVVRSRGRGFLWAECDAGAFVLEGTPLELRRQGKLLAKSRAVSLPFVEEPIRLRIGDRLVLTAGDEPGRAARYASGGRLLEPAQVPCTLPQVFKQVHAGERIFFDDGKIGGVIRRRQVRMLEVEITQAGPGGSLLRADKGINLPDSELSLPSLTDKDLEDLKLAAEHADMVGLSFVHQPADILALEQALTACGGSHLGILIKIENRQGFEQLPRILLVGLQSPPIGVVVARGDLAVEMGFERLAEVQEEILWLCEAAHVPVIWATQVLESLAKKGQPSRAEVTDAAMSVRAECVMLNKGPYILEAVRFLDNVLQRMLRHQEKKRSMLRRLSVSEMTPV
jgi:pyruvate kinase